MNICIQRQEKKQRKVLGLEFVLVPSDLTTALATRGNGTWWLTASEVSLRPFPVPVTTRRAQEDAWRAGFLKDS